MSPEQQAQSEGVDLTRGNAKGYLKKRLSHFQVHRVLSVTKSGTYTMCQLEKPFVIDGVPEGHFCIGDGYILLPRRKRGETFVVHYTVMNKVVL